MKVFGQLVLLVCCATSMYLGVYLYNGLREPIVPNPVSLDFLSPENRYLIFVVPSDSRWGGGEIYFERLDVTPANLPAAAICQPNWTAFDSEKQLFLLDCLWHEGVRWMRSRVPVSVPVGEVVDWRLNRMLLRLEPVTVGWGQVNELSIIGLLASSFFTLAFGIALVSTWFLGRNSNPA